MTKQEKKDLLTYIKESTPCADCDQSFPSCCMDFDHLDKDTKTTEVGTLVFYNAPWEEVETEIGKCELVCSNCHRIRTVTRHLAVESQVASDLLTNNFTQADIAERNGVSPSYVSKVKYAHNGLESVTQLTPADHAEIRRLHSEKELRQCDIARVYEISQSAVSLIVRYKRGLGRGRAQ